MFMEQHWIFLLLGLAPHEQEGVSKFRNEIWFNGLLVRSRNSPPRRVKLSSVVCMGHSISYVIGCFFFHVIVTTDVCRFCRGCHLWSLFSSGKNWRKYGKDIMAVDPQKNPLQMTIHSNFWIAISEVMWIDMNDSCAIQSILLLVELKGLEKKSDILQIFGIIISYLC